MITRMAPAVHTSALPERTLSLLLSDIPQVACGMTESSPIEGYAGAQNNLLVAPFIQSSAFEIAQLCAVGAKVFLLFWILR